MSDLASPRVETPVPSKHTAGPWVASRFGFQVLTGDSWSVICTLKNGAEWEDRRGKYVPNYEWQNQEANARLIAAAPEMLAALKKARVAIATHSPDPTEPLEEIDAAIAKAGA